MAKLIKNILLVLVLVVGVFTLSACGKSKETGLVGVWEHAEEDYSAKYDFKNNNSGTYTLSVGGESSILEFTYKIEDNKIVITFKDDEDVFETKYNIDGNTLTIKDSFDEEIKFIKK